MGANATRLPTRPAVDDAPELDILNPAGVVIRSTHAGCFVFRDGKEVREHLQIMRPGHLRKQMADITLQYVNSFYDARGKLRHQFRRKGHKRVSLPGLPGSVEFMDAYQAMIEKTGGSPVSAEIGASRTKAGTIDALIVAYCKHDAFTKSLAKATQAMRRPILDRFRELRTPRGRRYGENHILTLRPKDIMAALEGKTRDAQKNWLKALRGLMAFAMSQGLRADDPSAGLRAIKGPKSSGHMTWLEPQVELYRQHHPLGTVARLALELLLNIAARRYDAHEIGEQHVIISNRDGVEKLCWRPHKTLRSTGKMLKIANHSYAASCTRCHA